MQTILEQMKQGEAERNRRNLGEKTLLALELKLIYAQDFTPHKVAYYQQRIQETKKTFNL